MLSIPPGTLKALRVLVKSMQFQRGGATFAAGSRDGDTIETTAGLQGDPLETLEANFRLLHESTTFERQGADVGTQNRSALFSTTDEQRKAAEQSTASHQVFPAQL